MKTKLLVVIASLFGLGSMPSLSQAETSWYSKENRESCSENLRISADLVGLSDDTVSLSIHCQNTLKNWHIIQVTDTTDGTLKRGSKFDGSSIGYLYKDYFLGANDKLQNDNYKGFFMTGAGYGDYEKVQWDTGEEIGVHGLFMSFGLGADWDFSTSWSLTWVIGVATGGVVTDRVGSVSINYQLK